MIGLGSHGSSMHNANNFELIIDLLMTDLIDWVFNCSIKVTGMLLCIVKRDA